MTQGSIPFSWESSPGISKFLPSDHPVKEMPHSGYDNDAPESPVRDPRILLPPGRNSSVRVRFQRGQDNLFLKAYREWTRTDQNVEEATPKGRYRDDKDSSVAHKKGLWRRRGLSVFSCKSSRDVREDNFFRPSNVINCSDID